MALHELRAPLTTVAYASELLLDSPRPSLPAATQRRHLESIHQSAADASSILTLFSRFIEVEHAGESPHPEPILAHAFRDPRATTPGPDEIQSLSLMADPRIVRHLVSSLWELADLQPAPRPVLCALLPQDNFLALIFEDPGPLHSLLFPANTPQKTARGKKRSRISPLVPFPLAFRLEILLRALHLLGGSVSSVHTGVPTRFQMILPLRPPTYPASVPRVRAQP